MDEEKVGQQEQKPEKSFWEVVAPKRLLLVLPALIAMFFLFNAKNNPDFAEGYAMKFYPVFSVPLHNLTSGIPFSLGELLIALFIVFVLVWLIVFLVEIIKKPHRIARLITFAINMICIASVVLFFYVFLFGINYHRNAFAVNEKITVNSYSSEQLTEACRYFAGELTEAASNGHDFEKFTFDDMCKEASEAYRLLSEKYSTLSGKYIKGKQIFSSELMSYGNITGVFYPFTMEANINKNVPNYTIPFTLCHEMAHLQGYMRENEANFIAFLACKESKNPELNYSGWFNAYIYLSNQLVKEDPEAWKDIRASLPESVINDLNTLSDYWDRYEGAVADISDSVNDAYLKFNGQESGTKSYDEVTTLLLAYYFSDIKG